MLGNAILKKIEIYSIVKVIFGMILISACAQIIIPIKPIPITLQTVAVTLIGLCYRPKEAVATLLLYLFCGACGMPIFNNFSYGFAKFAGPTAGYLFAMPVAVFWMSYIREKSYFNMQKLSHIIMLVTTAHIVILGSGVLWLSTIIGFEKAIFSGFLVFIPSGIIKSLIISLIFRYIHHAKSS